MINIIAPINQLGYGIAGLNIAKHLSTSIEVALWPISQPQVTNQNDADIVSKLMKNSQMPNFDAPCIRIWHQNDMSQFVGNGTKIGFPIFELDTFNNVEKHHLSYLDKIFVCSNWAKDIVIKNLKIEADRVSVIPLGVDSTIFNPPKVENSHNTTIFFNCGKWEIRKGHDILVDIFNDAFSIEDNVELWMMCDNPFLKSSETAQWQDLYKQSKLGSKIKMLPRLSSQQEVYYTMANVDCGIFPSRAEGWNLELLELMACGKHVITSNYSAHTEFCNTENAHLVNIDALESAKDGRWFFGQGNWAKFGKNQLDQYVEHMKKIHKLKQSSELYPNKAGLDTASKFSWQNTAEKIIQHV